MGLANNMPPFSLSAHHFVQKGERLLILDHTLMDVLVIQIPSTFAPSLLAEFLLDSSISFIHFSFKTLLSSLSTFDFHSFSLLFSTTALFLKSLVLVCVAYSTLIPNLDIFVPAYSSFLTSFTYVTLQFPSYFVSHGNYIIILLNSNYANYF